MADIFSLSKFGKTTKYLKKGGKYYRIKANGQLATSPASGLVLANLKNKDSSLVEKVNATETKKIVSKFTMPDGKANASTVKASVKKDEFTKEDGGKAAFQKKYPESLAKELKREKAALAVIKKDTNNLNTGSSKNKVKKDAKKDITKMRTSDIKMVTLKSGKKGTIKQRMAELDADKEKAQRAKNSPKANKALDEVFAMLKKMPKSKKANMGGYMTAKKKMMGGGYSMKRKK
jgi:hypothetical protein